MNAVKSSVGLGIAGDINVTLFYSSVSPLGLRSYLVVNVLFLP